VPGTGKFRRGLQNALFCGPLHTPPARHETMNVATQLQAVVVAWQICALTHDPLSLGLIGLAEAIPFIGFALPAAARRRWDRPLADSSTASEQRRRRTPSTSG
jgi:hypothetical protein